MTSAAKRASVDTNGTFRCCTSGLPVDAEDYVLSGKDGEYAPCHHCKGPEGMRSGFVYIEPRNTWIPAWVYDRDYTPPEAA